MASQITDTLPRSKGWLHEIKWDGVRALAHIKDGALTLFTRNNNRCDRQYAELHVLPHFIEAETAIIDCEIVVLDANGISKFELIQPRIHQTDAHAIAKMGQKNPVHFIAFDLLYLDGYDLRGATLQDRKKVLSGILKPHPLIRYSEHFEGTGEDLLQAAKQTGLEGLICKRANSLYESRRSPEWLKLKLTTEQEFVIVGYTAGQRDTFASLVLACRNDEDELSYVGNVGTGFTEVILRDLLSKLEPRVTPKSPLQKTTGVPKGTIWVTPELIAQVKFANWTSEGRLRAPVYVALREDKAPSEVVRERPGSDDTVRFTNVDKIYFPKDGYTKGELLLYYDAVAALLVPHLQGRPLSLKRYPNGIAGEYFFQKNTPDNYPAWLRTEVVDKTRFIICDDRKTLLYLANLGCIDQNPWMSRVGTLANPDFILIDLDPFECAFTKVVRAAGLVKEKLDAIGLKGYPKTTGGDGLHVYIPVEPVYTYEQARFFAELIGRLLASEHPKLFTTPRAVEKREKDRVYFDWMQIGESKTISAPYVVRAYDGAPVSTPLEWSEVTPDLHPSQFNMKNAPERFAKRGDLFEGVLRKPQRIEAAFAKLEKLIRG
jgi:bifunctional non-homologous end joining protein LigD